MGAHTQGRGGDEQAAVDTVVRTASLQPWRTRSGGGQTFWRGEHVQRPWGRSVWCKEWTRVGTAAEGSRVLRVWDECAE